MPVTNDQMSIDACERQTDWRWFDVSALQSTTGASTGDGRCPLICFPDHDVFVTAIKSYVANPGNASGSAAVVKIGTLADDDFIGTVTVSEATTPAAGAVSSSKSGSSDISMNTATRQTPVTAESRGGWLVPKGTPIIGTYAQQSSNVAERAIALEYVIVDEHETE